MSSDGFEPPDLEKFLADLGSDIPPQLAAQLLWGDDSGGRERAARTKGGPGA